MPNTNNQVVPEDELQGAPVKGQTMENVFFHTRKVEATSSSFASHAAGVLLRLFVQNLFSDVAVSPAFRRPKWSLFSWKTDEVSKWGRAANAKLSPAGVH